MGFPIGHKKGVPKSPEHKEKIRLAHVKRGVGLLPKKCSKCGEIKPRDEFGRRENGKYSRPACKECERLATIRRNAANPDRMSAANRRVSLRRYFGITVEQYDQMLAQQGGRCAICARAEADAPRGRLHVDHCAESMRIRGLLCSLCNTAIGALQHDAAILRAAIDYLTNPPANPDLVAKPGMRCGIDQRGRKPQKPRLLAADLTLDGGLAR